MPTSGHFTANNKTPAVISKQTAYFINAFATKDKALIIVNAHNTVAHNEMYVLKKMSYIYIYISYIHI
jgi:hypothetical protein